MVSEIHETVLILNVSEFKTEKGIFYHHGRPFTGLRMTQFGDGSVQHKTPFRRGLKHGLDSAWYPNGQVKYARMYAMGKKAGVHSMWYDNGVLKSLGTYQNDFYQGNLKEWYPDGNLYRDFNYVDGQEAGLQQMWKSDGRIKANYVVRQGRRYGLTGVKNCVNVFEDE